MADPKTHAPLHEAGEAGSGTIPGDRIGAGGVTGGTGAFDESGGLPPRSRALGTKDDAAAGLSEAHGMGAEPPAPNPADGTPAGTIREHTVVPEARWGVTSGAPSGGIAGGAPAQVTDEEE